MLNKIKGKQCNRIVELLENYQYKNHEINPSTIKDYDNETQNWDELYINTENKNTGENLTLIFDYFGLVNLEKNNKKILEESDQIELLKLHPELIPVSNKFVTIMTQLNPKQFPNQLSCLYNCHEAAYSASLAEIGARISELHALDIDNFEERLESFEKAEIAMLKNENIISQLRNHLEILKVSEDVKE